MPTSREIQSLAKPLGSHQQDLCPLHLAMRDYLGLGQEGQDLALGIGVGQRGNYIRYASSLMNKPETILETYH
ncbi:hypothetical protein GCM10025778_00840 [Paeniglutamicibacter antarcticus]|uniref:Uncharacterized protein n=1 Tax=Paeniglutamicibacter antarcticus TaxID=494023 RepID=A0ABP9TEY6_9MICC